MSLNWLLTRIKDYQQLCWLPDPDSGAERKQLNPLTNALIWATIPVGINRITEQNCEKFFLRLSAIEHISGAFLYEMHDDRLQERPIMLEDIRQHIGLWTNAGSLTDAQFRRNLATRVMREAKERLQSITQ